jgi:hypothetical protein
MEDSKEFKPDAGNNEAKDGFRFIKSSEWKNLAPNFNNPDSLLPQDLTYDHINAILQKFKDLDPVIKDFRSKHEIFERSPIANPQELFPHQTIGGLGELEMIGAGEEKDVFLLTTAEGKKMVISLRNGSGTKQNIPEDPKIYEAFTNYVGKHYFYSDFRTYLTLPLNSEDPYSKVIDLQEYGGTPIEVSPEFDNKKKQEISGYASERGLIVIETDTSAYLSSTNSLDNAGIVDIKLRKIEDNDKVRHYSHEERTKPSSTK